MHNLDLSLLQLLHHDGLDSKYVQGFMIQLAENDLVKGGLLVAAMWWAWFSNKQNAYRREIVIAGAAAAIVAAGASRGIAHLFPFQARPFEYPDLGLPTPTPTLFEYKGGSFPSDHMALGFALVFALWMIWPVVGIALGVYCAAVVGITRIYLAMHWPSDVIGGALLGIVVAWVFTAPWVRKPLAAPLLRVCHRQPQLFYPIMFLVMFGVMTRFSSVRTLLVWAVGT